MPTPPNDTTAAIWSRLIRPDEGDMAPEAARFFLRLSFGPQDLQRMHDLAARHQDGTLSSAEQEELRSYRQVGLQVDLLRAKARLSLRRDNGR